MSRKLDAAIAEALGYEVIWVPVKRYSIDGEPMLDLEEEMRERGFGLSISRHGEGGYKACWWQGTGPFGMCEADTMPEAVALAAYHALTGKEWTK